MRFLLLLVLLSACGAESQQAGDRPAQATAESETPSVASPVSVYDLALPDLQGDTLRLEAYRGQHVLVNFWATWCAPCRQEIPDLLAMRDLYGSRGFEVVGISMDVLVEGNDIVTPFVEEFDIDYPIVIGDQRAADAMGGMFGLPTSFLVGPDGEIIRRFTGLIPVTDLSPYLDSILPEA